jgi:predicted phosphatase
MDRQLQPNTKDVNDFLMNDNFIVKKHSMGQNINWENFDTIILDADDTIWTCINDHGEFIAAYETVPPYQMEKENICYDSVGNKIQLKESFVQTFSKLKNSGKNIYMVSKSENHQNPAEQQPVVLLLETFGIYEIFDDVIIDSDTPKSEHVLDLQEGNTAFVDDDIKNLSDVANNTNDVVPIDSNKISY